MDTLDISTLSPGQRLRYYTDNHDRYDITLRSAYPDVVVYQTADGTIGSLTAAELNGYKVVPDPLPDAVTVKVSVKPGDFPEGSFFAYSETYPIKTDENRTVYEGVLTFTRVVR